MMILSNLWQGAVTALVSVLYYLSALNFSVLIFLVLLIFAGAQFYQAANGAIIPRIVSKENLGAANGLFTLTTSTNQLASYSAGGLVILAAGPFVAVAYDSLTFFAAAAILTLVLKSYGQARVLERPEGSPEIPRKSFWKDFREGLAYVKHDRLFLQLIVFGLIINGFGGAIYAILSPYAGQWLHGNVSTYAFILSAFLLGTIAGSIVIGKVNFRNYVGKFLFAGVIIFGILLAGSGFVTSVPVALALFLAIGFMIASVNIPITALIQTHIPGELLGRTTTVLRSLLVASQPVAAVLAGSIAVLTSIGAVFVGSGSAIAIMGSILYLLFAELRNAKY